MVEGVGQGHGEGGAGTCGWPEQEQQRELLKDTFQRMRKVLGKPWDLSFKINLN